jgi:hypothetical protein
MSAMNIDELSQKRQMDVNLVNLVNPVENALA